MRPEPSEALSQVHGHYTWPIAPIGYRAEIEVQKAVQTIKKIKEVKFMF